MEVRGVRSSWLTMEMKSRLACSASLRSVTSRTMVMTSAAETGTVRASYSRRRPWFISEYSLTWIVPVSRAC